MPRTRPAGSERRARGGPGPGPRQPLSPCVAGERLCSTEEATAGNGTYTRHGFIFSSLAGCLERKNEDNEVGAAAAGLLLPGLSAVRPGCTASLETGLPRGIGLRWGSAGDPVHELCPVLTLVSCPAAARGVGGERQRVAALAQRGGCGDMQGGTLERCIDKLHGPRLCLLLNFVPAHG